MNKKLIVAAFAFFCAFSFGLAESDYETCGVTENSCMKQCCNSAGGTYQSTLDYGRCQSETANKESLEEAYMNCTIATCRPELIECLAPASSCTSEHYSCVNSCKEGGSSSASCDQGCINKTATCIVDYRESHGEGPTTPSDSSCCGAAFILAFALVGAFASRKE